MPLPSKEECLAQLSTASHLVSEECSVCYEAITAPAKTACDHNFCAQCLKTWLDSANTCPSCRTKLYEVPAEEAEVEEGLDAERIRIADIINRHVEHGSNENESATRDIAASMNEHTMRALVEMLQAVAAALGDEEAERTIQELADNGRLEEALATANELLSFRVLVVPEIK